MRYYIFSVQHNSEKNSENRTVPKAFDNRHDAIREYHNSIAKDMGNATIDWSITMLINDAMGVEMAEKYIAEPITDQEDTADTE